MTDSLPALSTPAETEKQDLNSQVARRQAGITFQLITVILILAQLLQSSLKYIPYNSA